MSDHHHYGGGDRIVSTLVSIFRVSSGRLASVRMRNLSGANGDPMYEPVVLPFSNPEVQTQWSCSEATTPGVFVSENSTLHGLVYVMIQRDDAGISRIRKTVRAEL